MASLEAVVGSKMFSTEGGACLSLYDIVFEEVIVPRIDVTRVCPPLTKILVTLQDKTNDGAVLRGLIGLLLSCFWAWGMQSS